MNHHGSWDTSTSKSKKRTKKTSGNEKRFCRFVFFCIFFVFLLSFVFWIRTIDDMAVIVDFYFRQYLTTNIQTASNMKGATFLPTCSPLVPTYVVRVCERWCKCLVCTYGVVKNAKKCVLPDPPVFLPFFYLIFSGGSHSLFLYFS